MPDYAVSTAFTGKDRVSGVYDKMGRSASRYGETASSALRQASRNADHHSTALRNATKHGYDFMAIVKGILAANAIRGGLGMVGGAAQKVGKDWLEFDDIMLGAAVRFDDIGTESVDLAGKLNVLKKATRDAVTGTRFSAVDAGKAMNELAKAGYTSQSAMGMLPNLMAFATAGQEDLAAATTMSSDILGAFGLRNKDVNVQIKDHILLNDKLTKSALLSTGDLRDMYETMQTMAPLSKELGMGVDEVLALSVALSNAGIKGTEAATALKRASLNTYASDFKNELAANGILISDKETGKLRKFTDVLGDAVAKTKNLRQDERIDIFKRWFGMYGLGGSLKLTQALDDVAELEGKIGKAAGTSEKVAAMANMSPLAKLIMLGNTAMEKGFQILDKFAVSGKTGIESLTEKIKNFDVRPIVEGLQATGAVLGLVYNIMKPFIPFIPWLVAGWGAWRAILIAMPFVPLLRALPLITTSLVAGLGPVGAMSTAFGALAASLTAAQVAMVALVGAFAWWQAIKSWKDGTDNPISQAAQAMGIVPDIKTGRFRWQDDPAESAPPAAPNAKEAQARSMQWMGQLNIAGAPPGSTVQTLGGSAPSLDMNMLGAQ